LLPTLNIRLGLTRPNRADVVVVGAGLAGLETGLELASKGAAVTILEAGPIGRLKHVNAVMSPGEAREAWLEAATADPCFVVPYESACPPHYTGHSGLRQSVGGRSLYWHGVVLPIEEWALAAWPADIRTDLVKSWQGGPCLYERTLSRLESWVGGALSPERSELVELLKTANFENAQPIPSAVRRESDSGAWSAYSALNLLMTTPREESGYREAASAMQICAGCRINRLNYSRSSDCHDLTVETVEGIQTVGADIVILAAGTVENTRLVAGLLGQNAPAHFPIVDHIVQGFMVRVRKELMSLPPGHDFAAMVPGSSSDRSNLFVTIESAGQDWIIDAWQMGEQLPSDVSWIQCSIQGTPLEFPLIHADLCASDERLVQRQQRNLENFWVAISNVLGIAPSRLAFSTFGDLSTTYANLMRGIRTNAVRAGSECLTYFCPLGTVDHESCTLAYGGFLDNDGRVEQNKSVLVVGPSTFPRSGAANPSLTSLALATRTASLVSQSH